MPAPLTINVTQAATSTPAVYTVPASVEVEPLSAFAHYNGAGAASAFYPTLTFYSASGLILARVFPSSQVAAGGSADVTFAPFLGLGVGAQSSSAAVVTAGMIAAKNGYARYLNAGDVLPKGAASKTFECWGKTNGDPAGLDLYYWFHGPNAVLGDSFGFAHNGNVAFAPNLAVNQGGVFAPFTQYLEWNDTAWHHFVMTYDGGTVATLYVDGIASSALTINAQNIAASQPLIIGNFSAAGTLGTAFVDEMAVYSGVLSAARVLAHYNARMDGGYSAAVIADSPIVYYRFNDAGPGLTMADSSGNGRNGTYSALFTPNSAANDFVYSAPDGAVV